MKTIIVLSLLLIFAGCLKQGPVKQERGYVIEKQYSPNTQQWITGTETTMKGNVVVTGHLIGQEEKYIIILKCTHGVVFSINKADLYGKLNKGDTVTIDYREMVNENGEVKDFHFIDANKY